MTDVRPMPEFQAKRVAEMKRQGWREVDDDTPRGADLAFIDRHGRATYSAPGCGYEPGAPFNLAYDTVELARPRQEGST